jgi:hypothetical protein
MENVTQQAQLDDAERRHLEKIVKQLRKRAEETVEYWVHSKLSLAEEDAEASPKLSAEERELRGQVEEAIEREQAGERSWKKARDLYAKGVGYTLVNRLAALRCMEVRGFLDRSPTRFRDDGVTPAADRLITDYFLPREAGIWTAFLVACQERSEEIEILFDLSDPYSLLYGDLTGWDGEPEEVAWSDELQASLVDLLQDLGGLLDEVEDAVWRADDVLGWMYEYYNTPELSELRRKADRGGLDPEDVSPTNQFYTPHWVVRMLTDNSLGKLFLEHRGTLRETIQNQKDNFSPRERKFRDPDKASSIGELCTYLVPGAERKSPTDFDHPGEIKVFDPAVGSGHFLLYAFDVLERIWWEMAPEVSLAKVPSKILENNLFGVDLDLRASQIAAFNLYLKARSRAEEFGNDRFELPKVGIVCASTHEINTDLASEVFEDVAGIDTQARELLETTVDIFEGTPGLGSLLAPMSLLRKEYEKHGAELKSSHGSDLYSLFEDVEDKIVKKESVNTFEKSDLKSFARLITILTNKYDVILMNPPYGSSGRMPGSIKKYVKDNYKYNPEYYINFFEVGKRVAKKRGRIGMLVPRSFMFHETLKRFREDLIYGTGGFDFLAEFGIGVLDNATVRTAGTVVSTSGKGKNEKGSFIRLSDLDKDKKEEIFIASVFGEDGERLKRIYKKDIEEFKMIPSSPLSYWVSDKVRSLFRSETVLDSDQAGLPNRDSGAEIITGVKTGNISRFLRYFWEKSLNADSWFPFPKGGEEAWMIPRVEYLVNWEGGGSIIRRQPGSTQGTGLNYFRKGVTYNIVKSDGRRFGVMPPSSVFSAMGVGIFTDEDLEGVVGYLNSRMVTYLMLAQTPERKWQIGSVAKLPWPGDLLDESKIKSKSKKILAKVLSLRKSDFRSPFYTEPLLLRPLSRDATNKFAFSSHPYKSMESEYDIEGVKSANLKDSMYDLGVLVDRYRKKAKAGIEKYSEEVDEYIFDYFNIKEEEKKEIYTEITLRTNDNPLEGSDFDPDLVDGLPEDFSYLVEGLLLHLSLEILEADNDGIVLLRAESEDEEADLMTKMTAKFEDIWGEYAEDRLQEVDEVLGNREPTDEPYPNLRHWLEHDLFSFHCDEFENTPILWELTTERLGEDDNEDAGFACLIDYHQLGPDVFDRLSARYLETRKAALRERRQTARRTAEGSKGTQAREAREEEKRCERALRQIDELETRISELTQTQPRDWADEVRDDACDLKPKVRRFRERLKERLETLDALHEEAPSSWFKDHFSDKFMESVNGNREEWIDALEDLEAACEQFARPADEPVEAHLYDLLPYFDNLTGSTHYSSNGIFFLNYYFSKGKDLAAKIDQGSKDRVTRREQLVADLARETDDDIELGKEINEACQAMKKHMDSDWKPRALEEVRTPGYRPVKKHGVAINITPLAEKKLVPKLVDKKVL